MLYTIVLWWLTTQRRCEEEESVMIAHPPARIISYGIQQSVDISYYDHSTICLVLVVLYFRIMQDKREVDFLVIKDSKPWFLVEVKSSDTKLCRHLAYFIVLFFHSSQ